MRDLRPGGGEEEGGGGLRDGGESARFQRRREREVGEEGDVAWSGSERRGGCGVRLVMETCVCKMYARIERRGWGRRAIRHGSEESEELLLNVYLQCTEGENVAP